VWYSCTRLSPSPPINIQQLRLIDCRSAEWGNGASACSPRRLSYPTRKYKPEDKDPILSWAVTLQKSCLKSSVGGNTRRDDSLLQNSSPYHDEQSDERVTSDDNVNQETWPIQRPLACFAESYLFLISMSSVPA
jgi:hypothetical protein